MSELQDQYTTVSIAIIVLRAAEHAGVKRYKGKNVADYIVALELEKAHLERALAQAGEEVPDAPDMIIPVTISIRNEADDLKPFADFLEGKDL